MSLLRVNDVQDTGGSSLIGRKNYIINGNFDVWQRGTGAFTGTEYTADRWENQNVGTTSTSVTQQSFTMGQSDVPNEPTYYWQNVVVTSSAAGEYSICSQKVEDVRTLAGQTATLSFWAKADANKDIAVEFSQNFGSGGSPSAIASGQGVTTCSLTTSWQKFTVTVSLASISGKTLGTNDNSLLDVFFWLSAGSDFDARTNSLGNQSGTFDIAQVQLEKGSSATQFEHRSYGEELALCQRYYCEIPIRGIIGGYTANDQIGGPFTWPVTMCTAPSVSLHGVGGQPSFSGNAAPNAVSEHAMRILGSIAGLGTGTIGYIDGSAKADAEL